MIRTTLAASVVVVLAACSASTPEPAPVPTAVPAVIASPSSACLDAVAATVTTTDPDSVGAALSASLDVCVSVEEWTAAVDAVGGADAWESDDAAVSVSCWAWPDTVVCQDARERGWETSGRLR